MKVLAFNSSPNMGNGATALILAPFLEGMEGAGAEVELIYVHKLNVNPCLGCFACWLKTPGQCVQKDDMETIYPKLAAADTLVLATPVYVDGMTGTMKTMIDRFIPLLHPFIEIRDDHCRHPGRYQDAQGKVVLVSVCGFHEMDNFDPLVVHVRAICRNMDAEFAGALLRPYAGALPHIKKMGLPVDDVYEAAKNAGEQLVRDGKIATEVLETVSQELIPREAYVQTANAFFHRTTDALEKKGD